MSKGIELEDIRLDSEAEPEGEVKTITGKLDDIILNFLLIPQVLNTSQDSEGHSEDQKSSEEQKPKRDFSKCTLVEAAQYGLLARSVDHYRACHTLSCCQGMVYS